MAQVVSLGLKLGAVFMYSIGFVGAGQILYAASVAIDIGDAREQRPRARRRAIAEFNASLQDRLEMVDITPDQPRTLALGRVRAVEGVRRRWVSGANDQRLTMVISLAGHEIDAVEKVYFDDVELALDGSGYVQTAPYFKERTESAAAPATLDGSGNATVLLDHTPLGGSVTAVASVGEGEAQIQTPVTVVSVTGNEVVLTGGPSGAAVSVMYGWASGTSTARVRTYLGAAGQNIGAALAAEYPGKITADDRFEGIAALVVDIDYDPDVYPQGRPNVTALFRGAKVYDPRADSTVAGGSGSQRLATPGTWAWSENPALHAYHYARHANGWGVPAGEIMPAADVAAEAAFCDTSTTFTLRKADSSTVEVTLPRYRSGIVISTAGSPREAMDEILESMAGRSGWAGGTWRFRAGRLPDTVFAMDETWLARRLQADGTPEPGPTVSFSNGLPREQKVNRVTGTCVDPDQRHQVLPFPAVQDAVLIASEGATYPLEVEYQAVNHIAHAQHLATLAIKRAQAPLRVQANCNLHAYPCELFDVGTLTLPAYGISGKTMEVTGWRWHPTEGVQLAMAEITAALFTPEAELGGRDPAPNTSLPSPWDVETLTGLTVSSGTTALLDGSIVTRTLVEWSAAAGQPVRAGGRVEVQFREWGADEWAVWEEDGASTRAIIPALRGGAYYVFRARFVSAAPLRVRGDWSTQVVHEVAGRRGPRIYRQTGTPTGSLIAGDIWFDTDDGNHAYVYDGATWQSVQDAGIASALAAADAAAALADGKISTFWQTSPPGSAAEGDIWFDTDDGYRQYRRTAGVWELAADTRIGDAINAAADAQAAADGKVTTFVQVSAPTAEAVGDLWFDSDDGYRLYRWNGTSWVDVHDLSIDDALASAAAAAALADSKIDTYWQASPPGAASEGDIWFDTDDGYKQYRYTSGSWVLAADTRIGDAINAAADAQATADGKVVTFVQASAPTAEAVGDLWIDSDDGNRIYRWNGSSWAALPLGTGGLDANSITEILTATDAGPTSSYGSLPGSEVTLVQVSVGPYTRDTEVLLAFVASVEYGADPDLTGPPTYAASPLTAQVGNPTDGWTTVPYGDFWAFESKQASVQALLRYSLPASTTRVYYVRASTSIGPQPGAAVGVNEWTDMSLAATVLKR